MSLNFVDRSVVISVYPAVKPFSVDKVYFIHILS